MSANASKVQVGDVAVCRASCTNPYAPDDDESRGSQTGATRVQLLRMFRDAGQVAGWALWYAPAGGGARRIEASDVDWLRSGL